MGNLPFGHEHKRQRHDIFNCRRSAHRHRLALAVACGHNHADNYRQRNMVFKQITRMNAGYSFSVENFNFLSVRKYTEHNSAF